MRKNIENNLSIDSVYRQIINKKTKYPYSTSRNLWSVPVYFVWRILQYDLGKDFSYPVIAQGMIINHPQELETKEILLKIESMYPELDGINDIRRIV